MSRPVFLFPGQGSYLPGALRALEQHESEIAGIFDTIDEVGGELGEASSRPVLFAPEPPTIETLLDHAPEALQLALFGLAVGVFAALRRRRVEPWFLAGHSSGEIAALTCAGAFDLADGARLVHLRNQAVRRFARPGGMVALGADVQVAEAIVTAIDDPDLAVACQNAPRQTAISGPGTALDKLHAVAEALGVRHHALQAPRAFHSPLMSGTVEPLRDSLRAVRQRPLRYPVYSTILARPCRDDDDLRELIAVNLVKRVRFVDVVRLLHARGATIFIECGGRDILTRLVRATVPGVATAACVTRASDVEADLTEAVRGIVTGADQSPAPRRAATSAVPEPITATTPSSPTPAPTPATAPAPQPSQRPPSAQAAVLVELQAMYAAALEYPVDVLGPDVDLEADLGVDSITQTELLSRAAERYGLSGLPEDFRLSDYPTLGHVVKLVASADGSHGAVPTVPAPTSSSPPDVLVELQAMYAAALEYPVDVLGPDVDLEADLGVDSITQTELLSRAAERYGLSGLPEDFRLSDYPTLGHVVGLVTRVSRVR